MLAIDRKYYAINSNPKREVCRAVWKRQHSEYAVISAFVKTALAAGHTLGVNDDGDTVLRYSKSYKAVMGAIMFIDDDYIFVYPMGATTGPRMGWVRLIYGNDGPDVISDYSVNLEPLMGKANEVSNRLYERNTY